MVHADAAAWYTGMVVVDASVLIALAKISRLNMLQRVYEHGLIGPVVYEEVVGAGRRIGALGVEQIEHAIDIGWLRIARPTATERQLATRILRTSRLHHGEAEALAIAKQRKRALVLDDKEARSMANALGLDYIGTAGVLLEAFFQADMTLEELEDAIVDLSRVIWLSPEVVAAIFRIAREER